MVLKKIRISAFVLFLSLLSGYNSYAEVIIRNHTGLLRVLTPDGKKIAPKPSIPLFSVPSGSIINIVSGKASISTEQGSTVSVKLGAYIVKLKEGCGLKASFDPKLKPVIATLKSGSIHVTVVPDIDIKERTGKISIAAPKYKEVIIDPDKKLPIIPNKARISILSGEANIAVTRSAFVTALMSTYSAQVDSNSAIKLTFDSARNMGDIVLEEGNATFTSRQDSTGNITIIISAYSVVLTPGSSFSGSTDTATGIENINLISGTLTVTAPDGAVTIIDVNNPNFTGTTIPPDLQITFEQVRREESPKDISPSQ